MRRGAGIAGRGRLSLLLSLVAAVSFSGCFYYDSSWLEREEEKKRAAARLRPAELKAPRRTSSSGARVALVRAYGTRGYASETLDWERKFAMLLRDASRVLEPSLGVTLESAGTSLWEPESGEASPYSAIEDLARLDSGGGAHWVVGFLQSEPKLVTDFHKLGYARHFTKYMVVRGSANPREIGHIEKFEGLSEAEREAIYSERKQHKIVTVFLHELGHTLGAVHRTAKDSIMSPIYDTDERGFDEATLALFRITLPARLDETPAAPQLAALASYLEKSPDGWVGSEREEMLNRLRAMPASAPRSPGTAGQVEPPAPPTPARAALPSEPLPLSSLPPGDKAQLDAAVATEVAGDARSAWGTAQPLFERHPRVMEVQELRCRLAKARRFFAAVVEAHCERLTALGGEGAGR